MKTELGRVVMLKSKLAVALMRKPGEELPDFFLSNPDELRAAHGGLGDLVLVRYEPADQFCKYIPIEEVHKLFTGYTVVGFYGDSQQPWTDYVEEAKDEKDAALKAIQQMFEASEGSVDIDDLFVVEVLRGNHQGGALNNQKCVDKSMLERMS
jgi:hypothetical protein